uniref:Uncharacterized protein n=1 Tax=Zea mays TaxID=4577 RepID=C4J2S8_MAIZE|nr:unknown [Zea mays]
MGNKHRNLICPCSLLSCLSVFRFQAIGTGLSWKAPVSRFLKDPGFSKLDFVKSVNKNKFFGV